MNWYDMNLRMYDPALARWMVQDPVIHYTKSTYNAFNNNPVYFADPSGADAEGGNESSNSSTQINSGVGGITFDLATHPGAISYQSYSEGGSNNSTNRRVTITTGENKPSSFAEQPDLNVPEETVDYLTGETSRTYHPGSVVGQNTPSRIGNINDGIGGFGEGLLYNGRKGNRLFVGTARPGKPVNLGITKFYGNGKTYIKPAYMSKAGTVLGKGSVIGTVALGSISIADGYQQDGGTFGQNAAVATGGVAGGAAGAWGGAKAGAIIGGSIGSVIPGVGTAAGALVGGIIGGIAGGYIGTEVGEGVVNAAY
ncbi:RHS repeat-associated core domain-containing protein [Empedobacter brevis]|uniref:RHS repeat-associated core domain-containing protein n=1 Tax=Empedobacter brevis TaxID=247 RepID=UPI001F3B8B31|nr:RHS repeat-associated core domain-containing protein [Empedobacter brevis]